MYVCMYVSKITMRLMHATFRTSLWLNGAGGIGS